MVGSLINPTDEWDVVNRRKEKIMNSWPKELGKW